MFEHSVKVPRLYKTAAKIAKEVVENNGSLKTLVYDQKHANIKALYALTLNCVKYAKHIDVALNKTEMLIKEPRLDAWLAKVLITELLWGKGRLPPGSKPVETILSYQSMLCDLTFALKEIERDSLTVSKPRYVRVNTLLISVNEAVGAFRDDGWTLVRFMETKDYDGFLKSVANLQSDEFMVDIHIKELLIFPPNTEFHNHKAYKEGLIFLQDKASCLAVHFLDPKPESIVLDLCAAPGMKTSYVACKMENKGTIYAVDANLKRLNMVDELMKKSGIECVQTMHKDLMTVNESCCPNVEYILVDPTCSGTGMTDRFDVPEKDNIDKSRIEQLFGFQVLALKRAVRHFPHAKRIVYSTCSLISDENERVVREVLINCSVFKLIDLQKLMPNWKNFGSDEYGEIGKRCLYAKPDHDQTNGFFVAVFERLEPGEVNEFLERNQIKDEQVDDKITTLKQTGLHKVKKSKKSDSISDSISIKSEEKSSVKKTKKKKTDSCINKDIKTIEDNPLTNGEIKNKEENDVSSCVIKKKKSIKRPSEDENSSKLDQEKKKKKSSKTQKTKKDQKENVEIVENQTLKGNDKKGDDEKNLGQQLKKAVENLFESKQGSKLIENKKKKSLLLQHKISIPIKEKIEEESKEEVNEVVKKEKKSKKTSENQKILDDTKNVKKKKLKTDEIKIENVKADDDNIIKESLRRKKNLAKKSIDTFLMSHIVLGTDSEEANSSKIDDGLGKKHKRKKIENLQVETDNKVKEPNVEEISSTNVESELKEIKKKKRRSSVMEETRNDLVKETDKKKVNDVSLSENLLNVSKKDGSSKKKKHKTIKEEVCLVNDDKSEQEVKKGNEVTEVDEKIKRRKLNELSELTESTVSSEKEKKKLKKKIKE